MILKLSLDLPEDESLTGMVRHLSRTVLENFHVSEKDIDDLEYVIGELSTNAVRHAEDLTYSIELELHQDRAIVTVSDKGKGFSFANVPAPGTLRVDEGGTERIGGWGLPLVQMLSDQVEFRQTDPHGTTVRAEKILRYDESKAASGAVTALAE